MSAIHFRAPLAAVVFGCLFASVSDAQTPAPAKTPTKAVATAGPWARVPAFPTGCFQNIATNQPDPFYARAEAARTAIAADITKQAAINEKIAQEFINIDPMEQAQRLQQWMMSNPQEAMAFVQAAQNAPVEGQAALQAFQQQESANEAKWTALKKSYDDARLKAYAPTEARRKAHFGKLGVTYSAAPKDLLEPLALVYHLYGENTVGSNADWAEGESINGAYDGAYKALCPQWWGANGKFPAYLKGQKDWFIKVRVPYLESDIAPRLQQYAIMNTPAATYRSTEPQKAALEYLALVEKVLNERDSVSRCVRPNNCDGIFP